MFVLILFSFFFSRHESAILSLRMSRVRELVGEIQDESDDEDENNIKRVDEKTLVVPGTTNIDEINELLHLNIKEDRHYQTIAGYVFFPYR